MYIIIHLLLTPIKACLSRMYTKMAHTKMARTKMAHTKMAHAKMAHT